MRDLGALGRVVVDRDATGGSSGGSVSLGELWVLSTMDRLLKDGLGLVELELGLEVLEVVGIAGGIGAAASVGEVELVVKNLITRVAPVALSSAALLDLLGVLANMAVLREVARQMLLRGSRTIGQTGVVLVVELVRTSHGD